jgi:hypothetical protein
MADFSIASQVQPVAAANPLNMLEHVQKMQTSNMLMQQRAAELEKETAIRGAAAKHGVGSQGYIDAVARIDPAAALAAMNQQRQAAAAGASASASAASAALSRLQGDKVTQDILAKKGDQFVMGLRSLESYPPEQQPIIYGKMYQAMPDTLKPFFNPIYSPKAAELAQMTAADFVAKAKENQPQLQPAEAGMPGRTAYMPGANGTLGTMVVVPEALPPGASNTLMPQSGGVNNLAPNVNNLVPGAAPAPVALGAQPQPQAGAMLPSQIRAQAAAAAQAAELETFKKKEAIKRDMSAELSPVEEQKLRTQVGEARANASESLATAQGVLDAAKTLRAVPDNDKNRILGLSGEYTYNVTDAAKNAQTKFSDIKGQVTAMAKAAAGSIGSMAVQEWKILADQIATLEAKNLTPKALNEQLDIIVHRAEGLMRRTKQNYTSTYSPLISRYEGQFDLPEPEPRPAPKVEEAPAAPASRRSTNGRATTPSRPPLSAFGGG